ncbi:hypothetical protein [Actinotalea subterranea]|uniref:hypothetical protein n=1 Tax=Actinotalea subterranea TaxID=2607497 RepID=UPI0011EDA67A|nr:hypothetical protein [Actinotalea subterranea]
MNDDAGGWTDEDDASVEYEALPAWHPSLFVDVFRTALATEPSELRNAFLAQAFVTPESVEAWGDFSRAEALFASGLRISMTAFFPSDDVRDVAYVRLVETTEHRSPSLADVPATAHATLVWRPELVGMPESSWRIHHLGFPVAPDLLPRTAPGVDPSKPA